MSLLDKLLSKRNIKSIDELVPEERAQFDRWNYILKGDVVTVDSLKDFCKTQVQVIEARCDGVQPMTVMQQACLHVYLNIIKAIEAPEAERSSLEAHLNQLINNQL